MKISGLITKITLISFISLFILSCYNTTKTQTIQKQEIKSINKNSQLDSIKIDSLTKEYVALYKELQSFKKTKTFIEHGLDAESKYKDWFKRVSELSTGSNARLLKKKNLIADNLLELANIYYESKGYETEYSDFIINEIMEAIDQ